MGIEPLDTWGSQIRRSIASSSVPRVEAAVDVDGTAAFLACTVLTAVIAALMGGLPSGRRFWLGVEDPRAMALFRIVFAFFVLCNINGLGEHFHFLFTDEGIFPADVARQVFAKQQFVGFRDGMVEGERWGFVDAAAVGHFLGGPRFSLLYFWDTPTAMWIHIAAFEVATLLLMLGLWTRASAIVSFVLMNSLFDRNPLFWEGTELVFRVFFVYLLFARSGWAWSVDEWWRRRRLARRGIVDVAYRPIPVWPRRLMMLQLAILFFTTGALKHGAVWMRGDAVYYALNLDHFYRVHPQQLSALLGTNVLRVATWAVRWGEMLFGLVFLGEILRVGLEGRAPTRTTAVLRWARTWVLGRRIWISWAVATMGGIWLVMNIGQFQTVMLTACLAYVRGDDFARVREAPAYGVPARVGLVGLLAWHVTAVVVWLVPEHERVAEIRKEARALVRPWLELTRTTQGWGMFAPNPPRQNVFMQVLVVDDDGTTWDMRSDVYAEERKPIPFVWNDRMRKMNRRIIGGESGGGDWYRKWYARWQCRAWALEHDGRVPREVQLVRLSYAIPSPEATRDRGWYRPLDRLRSHGKSELVHTERCATAVLGQPLPAVAQRHAVVVSAPHRPWTRPRRPAQDPH